MPLAGRYMRPALAMTRRAALALFSHIIRGYDDHMTQPQPRMTPDRFRECLAALQWSQRGFADYLGLHYTTVQRMAAGRQVIPDNVADWLDALAAAHQARPFPVGWTPPTPLSGA